MIPLSTAIFGSYRNGEFLQFMKNVISIYRSSDTDALMLSSRLSELTLTTTEMDAVFMLSNAHELTPELQLLDTRRDKAVVGIKLNLETQKYREEADRVKAADVLLINYLSHGDRIDRLSYQQETAVINAMMHDWDNTPSMVEAITTLGLKEWVELLKSLNSEFDQRYVQRAQTTVQPAQIEIKRVAMKNAYDNLTLDTISYSRISATKAPYISIIEQLNGLVSGYNNAINLRLAGRSTDTETVIPTQPEEMPST